jgi:hypothetical protein
MDKLIHQLSNTGNCFQSSKVVVRTPSKDRKMGAMKGSTKNSKWIVLGHGNKVFVVLQGRLVAVFSR